MMDSAVGPPEQGHTTPESVAATQHDSAERADLVLATASAALLFAVLPIVLGVFTLVASMAAPTAVVLAVGGASLIVAVALEMAAGRRRLGLDALFAADLCAVALIAVVVAFSDQYHSPYVELFLLAVVHAAAFQSRMRVISLTLAVLLAYLVPSAAIAGLSASDAAAAVIPALVIVLGGGLIYAAAERLRRQRDSWADREALARRLADQDPLTGLGNYRLFWRTVEREVARVRRHGGPFSVVLLDLDRFKAVNDDLGHRAGDAMLQRVAHALSGAVRREDVTCRHGGDEFAVVAVEAGAEEADQLAGRLVDAVAKAGVVDRHRVTATAGWATFGVHAETVEELVLQADEAMRTAKRGGRRSAGRAVGSPRRSAALGEPPSAGRSGGAASEELALLGNLARALAAARDERGAVETAVAHLVGAVDAVIVAAARLDREGGRFETVAFAGPRALVPPMSQPADAGILGAVAAGEHPVLVGDVRGDARYIGLPELPDVRSELAVPVFDRGALWGVLNLESDRADAYTQDELHLVQAVSVQLGRALACVWAFAQIADDGEVTPAYELAAAVQEGDESWRVADLAWRLGRELGLEGEELESLYLAALFHNVGTVGVPASLMLKPGRLTDQELALVHEHPVIGERMLRPLPRLHRAASVVRHQHERFDGRGYPDGLSGEEIPLTSRALLACDAYVAMTSARPYRPARGYAEALAELRHAAGSQLDPKIVAAVLRILEPGTSQPAPTAETV